MNTRQASGLEITSLISEKKSCLFFLVLTTMSNSVGEHLDPLLDLTLAPLLPSDLPAPATVAGPSAPLDAFDPDCLLSDNERDPIYLSAPQSWAERNPTAGVQKQRLRAKLTDAAKATKQITAARNRAQGALLTSDIEKFMTLKQTQIERIALAHSRKVSDIEKLINHSTNYRPS
jgi:hypothetical protein